MAKNGRRKHGDLFDFNRDGKVDFSERLFGIQIMRECLNAEHASSSSGRGRKSRSRWREECEDDSEYGIFPEDYETKYEYNEVLAEAKNAWREYCEDGSKYARAAVPFPVDKTKFIIAKNRWTNFQLKYKNINGWIFAVLALEVDCGII